MSNINTSKQTLIQTLTYFFNELVPTAFAIAAAVVLFTGGVVTNALLCVVISVQWQLLNKRPVTVMVMNTPPTPHEKDVAIDTYLRVCAHCGQRNIAGTQCCHEWDGTTKATS